MGKQTSVAVIISGEKNPDDVQLRDIQAVFRDPQRGLVNYVTSPVKSWSSLKEFFSEQGSGLSDYLFDEMERAQQSERYYKARADVSLKVSDELKTENALLRQRIESLERKLKQAETDSGNSIN